MQVEDVLKKLDVAFTIDLMESVVLMEGLLSQLDLTKVLTENGYKVEDQGNGTMVVRK